MQAQDDLPDWPAVAVPPAAARTAAPEADLRVFLGSTWLDMRPERAAVERALHRLRTSRFVGMEYFGAQAGSTRATSLAELDRCDVYVGVIGLRYGSGITEDEYRHAQARGVPCLVYVKEGPPLAGEPAADVERLQALRRELSERHTVGTYREPDELATKVVADLHNVLFDRLVVRGIGQLRTDYDRRIRLFLSEYLGTPQQPIAFGGRDDELDALDRWLDEPASPPYALVSGPAGRGKSALLVHWARRLSRRRPDIAVVFFPVSIRFRTNLAAVAFAAITARLAALRGEPVPGALDTPTEVWRELMASALARPDASGRQVLVVLDAADEAADWEPGPDLFPARPRPGLRVLVSARTYAGDVGSSGWLERLGWLRRGLARSVMLDPLTPLGLTQVLQRMSVPLEALSVRTDIVAELYRLSQGDPLLVNLYVADLWARGDAVARLQPEDLAAIEPGLDGYFRRWWNDQRALWGEQSPLREPAVRALLDVMACALGPLLTAELLQLMPRDAAVSLWELDDAMQVLQRFVIGDGVHQGYAFNHPRLGEYFYERLDQAGQARAQEMRFVDWGSECVAALLGGRLEAGQVPAYVLQFQRRHMERAGSPPAAFMDLGGKGWAQAWERLDQGTYNGFLTDLTAVRAVARQGNADALADGAPPPFLADEVRCALFGVSIAGLAAGMSSDILQALVARGAWSAALAIAYAARISQARQRLATLAELTAALPSAYRPLGLAAVVAELRAQCGDDAGRDVVRDVLREWLPSRGSGTHRRRWPQLLGIVCEAGAQLAPSAGDWLGRAVVEATHAAGSEAVPAERRGTALRALLPWLSPQAAALAREHLRALTWELATRPARAIASLSPLRLALLRDLLAERPDDPDGLLLTDALRAAVQVLMDRLQRDGAAEDDAVDHVLACERHLPLGERIVLWSTLAPRLPPSRHDVLTRPAPDDAARVVQVHALAAALAERTPQAGSALATALSQALARAGVLPTASVCAVMEKAAPHLSTADWERLLERLCDALAPAELIVRLARIDARWRLPARRASGVAAALSALGRLAAASEAHDALLGLMAALDARDGVPARALPESCHLGRALQDLLSGRDVDRAVLEEAACELARGSSTRAPDVARAAVLERLDALRRGEPQAVDEPAPPGIDAAMEHLLLRHAEGRLEPDDFALLTDDAGEARQPLHEALVRLCTLSRWMAGEALSQGFAQLTGGWVLYGMATDERAELAAAMARALPTPSTREARAGLRAIGQAARLHGEADLAAYAARVHGIPLPDDARATLLGELLDALLQRRPKVVGAWTADLLLDVGRLAQPPDELVRQALVALATAPELGGGVAALRLLTPHTKPASLALWLEAFAAQPAEERPALLVLLAEGPMGSDASFWDGLADALGQVRSPQRRAAGLCSLAEHEATPARLMPELLALARALDDAALRVDSLLRIAGAADPAIRRAALHDAMAVPAALLDEPTVARLVSAAADSGEAALVDSAFALAQAMPDRARRSDALATLAPRLSASAAVAAATSLLRLDDAPMRLRTLRMLVAGCASPALRAGAALAVQRAVEAQFAGAQRDVALLLVADGLPPERRWAVIDAAMQVPRLPPGFDSDDVLDVLQAQLPDAPARVVRRAVRWLHRLPPGMHRSRTVAALVPCLPSASLAAAALLLAEWADDAAFGQAAPWIGDAAFDRLEANARETSEAVQASVRRLRERQRRSRESRLAPPLWPDARAEEVEWLLLAGPSDVERVQRLCRLASHARLRASARGALGRAALRIADAPLRRTACAYVVAFDPDAPAADAARAAASLPSAADRAAALARLAAASVPPEPERLEQALAEAARDPDELARAFAVVDIAVEAPAHLSRALDILATASDDVALDAWRCLLERLPDAQAATAIERSADRFGEVWHAWLVATVAARLGARAVDAALAAAARAGRAVLRARTLAALAPRLTDAQVPQGVALLDGIDVDFAWLEALGALAERSPAVLDAARARSACAALAAVDDERTAAAWLARAAAAWPREARAALLEAAGRLSDDVDCGDVLHAVIEADADAAPLDDVVAAAARLRDPLVRACVLGHAAARLGPSGGALLDAALREADACGARDERVASLAAMALQAGVVLPRVLDGLRAARPQAPGPTLAALQAIAPLLDADQALQALDLLDAPGASEPSDAHAELLIALAPRMAPSAHVELLHRLHRACTPRAAVRVVAAIAPLLDAAGAAAALELAGSRMGPAHGLEVTGALLARLDAPQQCRAIDRIAAHPREIERLNELLKALPSLTPPARSHLRRHVAGFRHARWAEQLDEAIAAAEAESAGLGAGRLDGDDDAGDDAASLRTALTEALSPAHAAPEPPRTLAPAAAPAAALKARLAGLEARADRIDEVRRHIGRLDARAQRLLAERLFEPLREGDLLAAWMAVVPLIAGPLPAGWAHGLDRLSAPAVLAEGLGLLAPRLEPEAAPLLYRQLGRLIPTSGWLGRDQFLARMGALVPVLAALSGDAALVACVHAVVDAGELWP